MNRHTWMVVLAALLALGMTSCRSSKKAARENEDITKPTTVIGKKDDGGKTKKAEKEADALNIEDGTNFTARVRVTVSQGDKDITTSGNLRMRYGEVIQITLLDPILGISEVGRLEMSPDSVLVIDRINKRYVSTPYADFNVLRDNNIDFATIQQYFWAETRKSDALSYTIPAKMPVTLDLELSNISNAANWTTRTSVSSRYVKTDVNKLVESLVNH